MPPKDANESPLADLQKRLYTPGAAGGTSESSAPITRQQAPEHWHVPPPPPAVPKKKIPAAVLFLGFAIGFFVIAGIAAAVILFLGGRSVSSDNVDITIEGPTTVAAAEGVPLLVTIKNNNPVPISGASLTLQFPDGTTEAEDTSAPLSHYTDSLGDIPAGGSVRRTVRASFFGTENQKVQVPVSVEYRTSDSNAVFVKKSQYDFTISTSPIGLSVTTLSEVASGQSLTLSVLVRSNASTPLENVAVRAEYPFGFSVRTTAPEADNGTLFSLGTLAPGEEREIRVTGTLAGNNGDERVFRFTGGALRSASSRDFAVSYTTKDAPVTIAKPFFSVALSVNRDDESPTIVIRSGEVVSTLLTWTNALSSAVEDGTITVAISGEAFDQGTVEVTNGFYRSSNKSVLFDRDTTQGLALLNPGDMGHGSFNFTTKTGSAMNALRNPSITLAVSVTGRRVGESGVAQNISSTLTRTLKVATDLTLGMRAVRTTGAFQNTGPWPPEADQETTYTIELAAVNTVNSVADAQAKMTLPSYVRYTGRATSAAIKYNESTRQITWTVGDLGAGGTATASFQVALLPSVSQKGTSPALVSEASLVGFDRFVQTQVTATAPEVDTETKNDPSYTQNVGTVKK